MKFLLGIESEAMVERHNLGWPPTGAPAYAQKEEHWKHFDNSVNAVSFGFVATAILISMFLVMAIFERFLRPTSTSLSPAGRRSPGDLESHVVFNDKLAHPSPKMSVYAKGVSVLMPGEDIPTFIAHPAPVPCPPDRMSHSLHQHKLLPNFSLNSNSTTNSWSEN